MDLPFLWSSNHSSRTLIASLLDRKYWQKYQLRSAVIGGCGERQRRSCRETITCHQAQHRRHSTPPHVVTSVTFYSLQQAKHRIAYVARLDGRFVPSAMRSIYA
jgi:hypothetical protein